MKRMNADWGVRWIATKGTKAQKGVQLAIASSKLGQIIIRPNTGFFTLPILKSSDRFFTNPLDPNALLFGHENTKRRQGWTENAIRRRH